MTSKDSHQLALQTLHESVSWENTGGVGRALQADTPETDQTAQRR